MKASKLTYWFILFVSFSCLASASDYAQRQIIVTYKETSLDNDISNLENKYSLVIIRKYLLTKTRVYRLSNEILIEELLAELKQNSSIMFAEPNYINKQDYIPLDPHFSKQWYLVNTGQVVNNDFGPDGVDIDWKTAMENYDSSESTIIAVIDSGVAFDHPDILANIWINEDEEIDGLDTDGNGYIDDLFGWDFQESDAIPLDENGHGTLVASIIAGVENNSGIIGVSPKSKIMALRISNEDGDSYISAALDAIEYALLNGAKIINYSNGGNYYSSQLKLYIDALNEYGVLFVASAGNGGNDSRGDNNDGVSPNYPASYSSENIISVAASDRQDQLAIFSNYGYISVDLAAPGVDIYGADISRSVVYFQDFEGTVNGWTIGHHLNSESSLNWSLYQDLYGNTWLTDSVDMYGNAVDYSPNTHSYVQSPVITLGEAPVLEFTLWKSLEYGYDYINLEVSTDQVNWDLIAFDTGFSSSPCPSCSFFNSGGLELIDLEQYAHMDISIRISLDTDSSLEHDGAYIDDITIKELDVFNYDGNQYQYNNGTSFSAPMVSGAAALLWSIKPNLPHDYVKAFIMVGVDVDPALSGKLNTDGRLNIGGSVSLLLADADSDGVDNGDEIINGTMLDNPDSDEDGVSDLLDAFPLDNSEHTDFDNDGIGDNSDSDLDNDGVDNEVELAEGTNPFDVDDCPIWACKPSSIWLNVFLSKD